jgi:hypothetical protein
MKALAALRESSSGLHCINSLHRASASIFRELEIARIATNWRGVTSSAMVFAIGSRGKFSGGLTLIFSPRANCQMRLNFSGYPVRLRLTLKIKFLWALRAAANFCVPINLHHLCLHQDFHLLLL